MKKLIGDKKELKSFANTLSEASDGKISEEVALICAEEINKLDPKDLEFNPDTCISFYENWWNISKSRRM